MQRRPFSDPNEVDEPLLTAARSTPDHRELSLFGRLGVYLFEPTLALARGVGEAAGVLGRSLLPAACQLAATAARSSRSWVRWASSSAWRQGQGKRGLTERSTLPRMIRVKETKRRRSDQSS